MSIPIHQRAKLERAGIFNVAGHLDRPLSSGRYLVPEEVFLEGETIRWGELFDSIRQEPNARLLDELLALSAATPSQVFEFVKHWGPIDLVNRICERYKPSSLRAVIRFAESLLGTRIVHSRAPNTENWAVYPAFANYVQRTLNLAAEIYNTQDESVWLARFPYHCPECSYGVERARQQVESCVRNLLAVGGVSFSLEWEEDQWQVDVSLDNTLGAIGVKVMLAVARADSLYTCYGCKQAYLRSAQVGPDGITQRRRPRPDQRNYCGRCGRKKALLDAKRRNRTKHHDARRLYEIDGKSTAEISAQLLTTEKRVRDWIRKGRWKRSKRGVL